MAPRREKLTLEIEPDLRNSLTRWAEEEGRPVGNLLRRIVAISVARHERQRRSSKSVAAVG